MKKLAGVFLFIFACVGGFTQCDCTVLFPLSHQYKVIDSDTVGDYATIRIGNDSSIFPANILIRFTDTFRREYRPIKIPFKVINHSDDPLVFTRVNWGGERITVRYSKEAALKGDTLVAHYTTLSNLNRWEGLFTKSSTVITNQCRWVINFRGIVRHTAKKEED